MCAKLSLILTSLFLIDLTSVPVSIMPASNFSKISYWKYAFLFLAIISIYIEPYKICENRNRLSALMQGQFSKITLTCLYKFFKIFSFGRDVQFRACCIC